MTELSLTARLQCLSAEDAARWLRALAEVAGLAGPAAARRPGGG